MVWPDILIAAVLLIAGLKGFKRGFIMELSGALALLLSLIVPWFYNGVFDEPLQNLTHAGPGAAHVIALFCVGVGTYLAVLLLARVLNTVAKLPVLGLGNAIAGAAVSLAKACVLIWLILYVALFFPLTPDVRADLHRSKAVAVFEMANDAIDSRIEATLPPFVRPMFEPVLNRHRV